MTYTPFVPAQVFHPVEIIIGELTARGWTLDDITTRAIGNHPHVDASCTRQWGLERLGWDIYFACAGERDGCLMGEKGAAALERALGIDADFWSRTEALWRGATEAQRSAPPDVERWLSGESA